MTNTSKKRIWRTWTPDDDLILHRLYPNAKSSVVADILGRSIETIRVRASFLDIKRCSKASTKEKSESAFKRANNADAIVYQPIAITTGNAANMSLAAFKKYELIATMKANARFLRDAKYGWLANLTSAIVEQVVSAKSCKQLKFLTIQEGMR